MRALPSQMSEARHLASVRARASVSAEGHCQAHWKRLHKPECVDRQQNKVKRQHRRNSSEIAVQNKCHIARNRERSERNQSLHAESGQHQTGCYKSQPLVMFFSKTLSRSAIEVRKQPLPRN